MQRGGDLSTAGGAEAGERQARREMGAFGGGAEGELHAGKVRVEVPAAGEPAALYLPPSLPPSVPPSLPPARPPALPPSRPPSLSPPLLSLPSSLSHCVVLISFL